MLENIDTEFNEVDILTVLIDFGMRQYQNHEEDAARIEYKINKSGSDITITSDDNRAQSYLRFVKEHEDNFRRYIKNHHLRVSRE